MASQTIKGLTVQISGDTTKLGTAVKDAENKSKSLGKELSEVNKLLKEPDANAVELLAQKQQILTERISATKEKLDTLKAAQASVQAQFDKGDITAQQYRAFQREIQYTANEMQGYEKAIQQTTKQLAEAKVKTGEEASSLDMLKAKISLQEQELLKLTNQYKSAVIAEGENSDKAKELKAQYDALNSKLGESKQKMNEAETAAASLGKSESTAITPLDALKKSISEQEKELDRLNTEYQNAVVQYGKNSSEAKALASQIKTLSGEHQTQRNKLEDAKKATQDITATEKTLTERYQEQKSELDALKTQYTNAVAQYGKNSAEAKNLAKQISSLSGELDKKEKKLQAAEKSADKFDKTLSDTSKHANNASDNVKDLGNSAKDAESSFNAATVSVGTFMGNLALELLQKATELIKNFAVGTAETGKTFEAFMSKVEAISGATANELKDLDAVARQYGRDTQYSASECADALSYMALAGWDVEDMTAGLPGVLNLAAASQMDLAKASDVVTDYMTAFGWEANRAGEFADKMAFAMANSNTDTEMLGEAYKNCASTAESLHYSMEETTAAIMTMANAGVKGGEAGTALNAVMTRLATDTKGCASELKQYGIDIYDEQGNMQSLSSILTGISETWETLTDEQQANLAKMIAGQQQYSSFQTIMKGLSDTAKENGQSFNDYTNALLNCDGAATEMAHTMSDNLQGDLKKMESAYQDLQLSIYDGINAPLREVVQTITGDVLPAFSNLVNGVDGADKEVENAVGKLISTVLTRITDLFPQFAGILGTIASTLIDSLPQLAESLETAVFVLLDSILDALPSALPTILMAIRRLWIQLFNNIGQLASATGELVQIIGITLIKELPKIGIMLASEFKTLANGWIPALTEKIPELLSTLLNLLLQKLPTILNSLKSILQSVISGLMPLISKLIPNLVSVIVQFLNEGIPMLLGAAADLFGVILDTLPDLITVLADVLPDIITTIIDVLLTNIPVVLDSATTLLFAIVDALPKILEALTAALPQIVEKLIEFFISEDNLEKILESGFTLLSALIDCIPDVISQLVIATADIVMAILTAIGEKLPDMAQKGSELFESLIEKGAIIIQKIIMFVPELIASIIGAISENYQKLQDSGIEMFGKIKDGIMSVIAGAYNWGADLIDNFITGIFGGENEITKAAENIGEKIWEYLHFSEPEKGKLADFSTYAPDMMTTFANGISENQNLVMNQLVHLSDSMAEQAQNTGNRFLNGVLSITEKLPGNVGIHLTSTVNNVIDWGRNLKQQADSAISDMVNIIENRIRSLPDKMTEVGRNLVLGLWNGMQNLQSWILSNVSAFCNNILESIFQTFDIHSPAKTMVYVGEMLDYGVAGGVTENEDEPIKAIRKMANNLLNETAVIPERLPTVQQQYTVSDMQSPTINGVLSDKLDRILQTIENGQVLMLDGNKLVGGTADRMNAALGQIQALSARR